MQFVQIEPHIEGPIDVSLSCMLPVAIGARLAAKIRLTFCVPFSDSLHKLDLVLWLHLFVLTVDVVNLVLFFHLSKKNLNELAETLFCKQLLLRLSLPVLKGITQHGSNENYKL